LWKKAAALRIKAQVVRLRAKWRAEPGGTARELVWPTLPILAIYQVNAIVREVAKTEAGVGASEERDMRSL
jgi:hypothetical protein